jgi:hypothetical protein
MNGTRKMGEKMEYERRIREIFENGTYTEVNLLLSFEKDPEVPEDTRKLITGIRQSLEKRRHPLSGEVHGEGHRDIPRNRNLSEIEMNKD